MSPVRTPILKSVLSFGPTICERHNVARRMSQGVSMHILTERQNVVDLVLTPNDLDARKMFASENGSSEILLFILRNMSLAECRSPGERHYVASENAALNISE